MKTNIVQLGNKQGVILPVHLLEKLNILSPSEVMVSTDGFSITIKPVIERTTEDYVRLLTQFKQSHGANYGITRMGIFGSVARREQTEDSDVDIYFESPTISLFGMVHLKNDLEELLKVPVDVVHKHDNMNPELKKRIEKEVIYV